MELIGDNQDLLYEVLKNCMNGIDSNLAALVSAEYLNTNCITNSSIAEIAKKSPQATLSMIKCNADFPTPFNVGGTNFYNKNKVISWLISNNKIAKDEDDEVSPEFLYGTEKTVVFVGGPGNGKSTIAASAAESKIVRILRKILSAGGVADTENLIKLHYKHNSVNYVVFHYGESFNDSIPIKITENNIERIRAELKKCKNEAKKLREEKEKNNNLEKLLGTYIEFVLNPNESVSNLMSSCNIDILTFIDTPGIDSKHSGESVSMADVVVMVLGDRDDVASITEKIKKNVVPQTGTSQYIYLYNKRFALNSNDFGECEKIYEEYFNEAKDELQGYNQGLKNLQDELVIGSTISACKPFDSLICVPNFSREPDTTDEFFFNKFCQKLKDAFTNSIYFTELNNFDMDLFGEEFVKLLNKHLKQFVETLNKKPQYTISNFIEEKHGRTKSLDNYRIEYSFNNAMSSLKNYFYKVFSKYKTGEYDENKSSVIRMVYLTINEGLMNKVHYGSGSHPWEDVNSPTQMVCEEVLSEKILNSDNKSYCQILKENKIKSNSWNYVYTVENNWNLAKIFISNKFKLPNFKAENITEYIEMCHFIPAILVQSVLSYCKINPSSWKCNSSYDKILENITEGIYFQNNAEHIQTDIL